MNPKRNFLLGRIENIVGKCWLPALSPFPTMISKASISGTLKSGLYGKRLTLSSIYTHFDTLKKKA